MSKEKNFIQVTYSSTILYISTDGPRYLCIGAELRKGKDKITENRKKLIARYRWGGKAGCLGRRFPLKGLASTRLPGYMHSIE